MKKKLSALADSTFPHCTEVLGGQTHRHTTKTFTVKVFSSTPVTLLLGCRHRGLQSFPAAIQIWAPFYHHLFHSIDCKSWKHGLTIRKAEEAAASRRQALPRLLQCAPVFRLGLRSSPRPSVPHFGQQKRHQLSPAVGALLHRHRHLPNHSAD